MSVSVKSANGVKLPRCEAWPNRWRKPPGRTCHRLPETVTIPVPDGACHVLDRDVGIDAVLIEEIDDIGPEPAERSLRDRPDVLRPAAQAGLRTIGVELEAELGRDHDIRSHGRECLADKLLIHVGTI